jgi:hypothetical protein
MSTSAIFGEGAMGGRRLLEQFSNACDPIRNRDEEEKRNKRKSRNKRSHAIAGSVYSVFFVCSVFLF